MMLSKAKNTFTEKAFVSISSFLNYIFPLNTFILYTFAKKERNMFMKTRLSATFIHLLFAVSAVMAQSEYSNPVINESLPDPTVIKADDGRDIPIMTMGPICIAPEYKRQGYGKILLDHCLEKAVGLGSGALCFEGNIDFYGKSGFTFARNFGIRYHDLPEGADDSFFLCKELIPGYLNGISGEYAPPEGYFAAEQNPED